MPNNDEKKVLLKVTDLKQWFPLKKTKLFQKEQEYVPWKHRRACRVTGNV